tara:strand:+ start:4754 stop:4945 length:192 start_codon:yes stop_codon:yes gene_type:complete
LVGGNGIDLLGAPILGLWLYQLFSYYLLGHGIISEKHANRISEKHANRFLGVGMTVFAKTRIV